MWVGPAKLRPEEGNVKAVEYVPQFAGQTESPVREGVRHSGPTAYFDDEPSAELDRDTLFVGLPSGPYPIALSQVVRVQVKRPDEMAYIKTAVAIVLAVAVAAWSWSEYEVLGSN
jgi:hypothetical protein